MKAALNIQYSIGEYEMAQLIEIVNTKKQRFLEEKQTIDNFTWKYEMRCRIQVLREGLKTMSLQIEDFKDGLNEIESFFNQGPRGGAA